MLRFAWLALVAGSLSSVAAKAETPLDPQKGYAFCTVTDIRSAQAKIWASPVLAVEFAGNDAGGFMRGLDLAGEFLAHVGTLGGAGDKSCTVMATQAEAAAFREEQHASWGKRVYFVKIGDWRDVAWTPKPWQPARAVANAAPTTAWFLCQATQTDIPDRSDRSRTVASGVFAMPLPGANAVLAKFEQASAYSIEFQAEVVQPHGLPVQGSCTPYDTPGEAQYAYQQLVRFSKGFNMKYAEVAWMPDAPAPILSAPALAPTVDTHVPDGARFPALGLFRIDPMSPALSESVGLPSPQGVLVAAASDGSGFRHLDVLLEIAGQAVNAPADVAQIVARLRPGFQAPVRVWRERKVQDISLVIPQPVATRAIAAVAANAPAPAVETALYCTAFVSRQKPALMVRSPVRKEAGPTYTPASATAALTALTAAVQQAHPGDWHDLSRVRCSDNSAVFAGEDICVVATYKRFGGGSQLAALYCNASREMIDQRWADMVKADGGHTQIFPWPASP